MTDAAWGIGGRLAPSDYPDSYSAAGSALWRTAEGDLVVLPFTSYRAPAWNGGRKVLDPLGRYLEPNYVVNDELSISGAVVAGEDPRVADIKAALGARLAPMSGRRRWAGSGCGSWRGSETPSGRRSAVRRRGRRRPCVYADRRCR